MRMPMIVLLAVLVGFAGSAMAQGQVESKGTTNKIKLDEVVSGYLTEINGKYKIRATELTYAPGGYIDVHHHAGPGIRYVISGTLTFKQAGKSTIYKAGDFFYESGNVVHTGHNYTSAPVRMIVFEVLPADWTAPSGIPVRSY